MNSCRETSPRITLWLDGELQGDEIALLEAHLEKCHPCREFVASEQRFLQTLRSYEPAHKASAELRARVIKILDEVPVETTAPVHLRERIQRLLVQFGGLPRPRRFHPSLMVVAPIVTAVLMAGIWRLSNHNDATMSPSPSSFALMAADTHRRYLDKQLPLEIASTSPERISTWFDGKVPFSVKLPEYQEESGQVKLYQLEGARLVGYKEDYAAYVAYRMGQRPISLVVTSNSVARPGGGEEIVSQGLTFHFDSIYGYKVITWTDRGLTYALVSDLAERGQQSCGVCHQGVKDHDLIDGLKPRSPASTSAPTF